MTKKELEALTVTELKAIATRKKIELPKGR